MDADRLSITPNGRLLTVSSTSGCMYTFKVSLSDGNMNKSNYITYLSPFYEEMSIWDILRSVTVMLVCCGGVLIYTGVDVMDALSVVLNLPVSRIS